jgi:hypothetical protein
MKKRIRRRRKKEKEERRQERTQLNKNKLLFRTVLFPYPAKTVGYFYLCNMHYLRK